MAKACIRCSRTLSLDEFYLHSQMADGHLNKCKDCCRSDAIKNRESRLDYYREYDRQRFSSERRKKSLSERQRKLRATQPIKVAARQAVSRAVRSGLLHKQPCEKCGCTKVDAHHDDYSKPLDVRWLCRKHHLMEHGNYINN